MRIGKVTTTTSAPKRRKFVKVKPTEQPIPVQLPKKKEADVPTK